MHKIDSAYSLEMGDELRNNKTLYEEKIRYFTHKYANPSTDFNAVQNWDFTYSH